MKKFLFGLLPFFLLLEGCASTPTPTPVNSNNNRSVSDAGRSFTVPIDDHTVWEVNIRRIEVGLDDVSKAVVEIKNELDRTITVDFASTRSHYTPSIGDYGNLKVEVEPGSYTLRPSAPSLGYVPKQISYTFQGGTLYKMTWSRSHGSVNPRG